jgi:hypothetical protein
MRRRQHGCILDWTAPEQRRPEADLGDGAVKGQGRNKGVPPAEASQSAPRVQTKADDRHPDRNGQIGFLTAVKARLLST